ncbi:hypothetical protein GH5_00830 [Leishmania sp. Ghana 2012 LV757]|uniref:hypothetical protein n=1 Tax=Leishmania sp. Ghana 2012 LV757 TaxID=2803181 RepID=UPI001B4FAE36|nr:hypothetical protein GH5_00830 [Leishmania sp. Ghana 2012 LV757]
MFQQTLLRERTTSRHMHASCLLVWVPYQLPALQVFRQTLAPLRVSIPCTLLRVHQRSATEPARAQRRYGGSAAVAVVAEWNTSPERVSSPFGEDEDWVFPRRWGCGLVVGSVAPPSNVAYPSQWVVLRVRQVSHKDTAAGVESCQQWIDRRLRLGTVLYASDWEFLVSRQERKATTTERTSTLSVTGSTGKQTVTADMEALSTFFPAVHHGRYYATAQAFVRHCRHSDEHLVWCEMDPLVSVEWVGAEEAPTEAAAHQGSRSLMLKECGNAAVGCTSMAAPGGAGTWHSRVRGSRKRRRRWLSQCARECSSARPRQVEAPSCTHHPAAEAATLPCPASTPAATSATALDSVCCAYLLTLKPPLGCLCASSEELVSTTAAATADTQEQGRRSFDAPPPPPNISRAHTDETLQSSLYASWYLALRPACRSALRVSHSAAAVARGAEEAGGEAVRHIALQEVFLHGIAASLALWFCKHGKCSSAFASVDVCEPRPSEPSPTALTASTGDAAVLVAALLRDWWDQLSREATQSFAVYATAARTGPVQRRCRRCVAHQVWASLQAWDRASDQVGYVAVAPPPAPLERLCVACAIVVTFIHRRQEQILWWNASPPAVAPSRGDAEKTDDDDASADDWAVPSDANGGAVHGTGRAPSIDRTASNTLYTSASCRLTRMSVKDSRRWCDDYHACIDLVLQLLFAEQQRQWTK